MSDNKKYYYMRLKEGFFEDDAIILLESMPDGYLYSNILLKMMLKSLKDNGRLLFNNVIPYSPQALATVTRHSVGVVEKALQVFKDFGLIEILDNGAIYMMNIQNLIGSSSSEADRQREYDRRIALEKKSVRNLEENLKKSTPEIEIEIEKELEIEIESETKINYQQIADMYNNTCVSFPRLKTLSDSRKKAIKSRLRTHSIEEIQEAFTKCEASDFLKGSNDRNWSATFDWMMKDSSIAKILDGNYDNKRSSSSPGVNKKNKFNNFDQRTYDYDELEKQLLNSKPY